VSTRTRKSQADPGEHRTRRRPYAEVRIGKGLHISLSKRQVHWLIAVLVAVWAVAFRLI
jgi:hypothetical protein